MNTPNEFENEIAAKVAEWDGLGREIVPAFITNEIIKGHEAGLARTNEHTEFFRHYTYKGHRKDVGAYIAKIYGDEEGDGPKEQHVLPGFEYVQRNYVVARGGEGVAVPVELMTDDEIDARVRLLRRRGRACLAHADELSRFKHIRSTASVPDTAERATA